MKKVFFGILIALVSTIIFGILITVVSIAAFAGKPDIEPKITTEVAIVSASGIGN